MSAVPDLRNLLEAAQRIQAEVTRVREELAARTVTGEAGAGLVRCTVNGRGEVLSLAIDPAIAGERKMVEDLSVGAVNAALDKARTLARDELQRATGGLPLPPGMFGS